VWRRWLRFGARFEFTAIVASPMRVMPGGMQWQRHDNQSGGGKLDGEMMLLYLILAQLSDHIDAAGAAVKAAASDSWEAALLAFIIVVGLFFIGFWMRWDGQKVKEREDRMAKRIDHLEDKMSRMHESHSDRLVKLTQQVTDAIAKSTEAQVSMQKCLIEMNETLRQTNTDVRDLCMLLRSSPCIIHAANRGDHSTVESVDSRNVVLHEKASR
jgi:hypothetical protein